MQVVIFCGGQGTRLREETEARPKPMVPIGGRPILWHIMKTFDVFDHDDFVLCLGYKGEQIKQYFLHYRSIHTDCTVHLGKHTDIAYHGQTDEHEFRVTLAETGETTMTGARLHKVLKYIDDDIFLATYGDGLCDVDIGKLVAFHRAHGKIATVTAVPTISRFGILQIGDDQRVHDFVEKPENDSRINAGYFVFDRRITAYLSDDPNLILEKDVLPALAHDGELMAFKHDGFFYAMDTYREYLHLNELWAKQDAPWARWLHADRQGREVLDQGEERLVHRSISHPAISPIA